MSEANATEPRWKRATLLTDARIGVFVFSESSSLKKYHQQTAPDMAVKP